MSGSRMTPDYFHLFSRLSDPLFLAGTFLVVGFLVTRLVFGDRPVARFFCQLTSFAALTIMLKVAGVTPFTPTPVMDQTVPYVTISVFKIVWWFAASWLLAGFVRAALVFKRQPVETRFLQDVCAGFIYVCGALAIVNYVFDMPVTGILAASGVIAIGLGLALQSTLGDLFSGLVLNLAKPYDPGDWITLDGGLEGRVIDTNWRATQILTPDNDLAIVPNSVIAKAKIVNASKPEGVHGLTITIRLDPLVAPSTGVAVLETAMLSCNRILRVPPSSVMIRSLDAVALECEMQFFVYLIEQAPNARNEVFDLVFRHCASAGIRVAPPSSSMLTLPTRGARRDISEIPRQILEHLPIFASLSDDERLALAPRMKRKAYKAGDVLVEQGAPLPALLILTSGVLAALQQHDDSETEVLRLAPGDCLGQASVLTGAPATFKVTALTKAIIYEIAKEDLAPILKERPAIVMELGQILATREAAGKSRADAISEADKQSPNLAARLTDRMKVLFGLE
jgi:small-conductance mechanosensitive channel